MAHGFGSFPGLSPVVAGPWLTRCHQDTPGQAPLSTPLAKGVVGFPTPSAAVRSRCASMMRSHERGPARCAHVTLAALALGFAKQAKHAAGTYGGFARAPAYARVMREGGGPHGAAYQRARAGMPKRTRGGASHAPAYPGMRPRGACCCLSPAEAVRPLGSPETDSDLGMRGDIFFAKAVQPLSHARGHPLPPGDEGHAPPSVISALTHSGYGCRKAPG